MASKLQPNLAAFADMAELEPPTKERHYDIEASVLASDATDVGVPPSLSTDLEDVPEGALEVATATLLIRLSTWCDLHDLLVGIEGLEPERLEVARQIDECLSRLARTLDTHGICWGCRNVTLTPAGVTCVECAPVIASMMLESVRLAEGIY